MSQIYKAINAIMTEIGAIGKNQKNQQQGFMYRGIDAVMNGINPALTKHKVFVVPEVLEQDREERTTAKGTTLLYSICKIRFTFYAEDGSSVSAVTVGEGMDSGDKATNKAMSIAFKYACFQVFCIPTEEMIDPDSECHEVAPKSARQQKKEPLITSEQVTALRSELLDAGQGEDGVLKWAKIKSIEELTIKQFKQLMDGLEKRKKDKA